MSYSIRVHDSTRCTIVADEIVKWGDRHCCSSRHPRSAATVREAQSCATSRASPWLNITEKDPEQFQKQVESVATRSAAPAFERTSNDPYRPATTGIQALERTAPTKLMIAGKPARIEFEYERHGTLTLIGNFPVTTGELIAPTIGPTRTEADFASHIE